MKNGLRIMGNDSLNDGKMIPEVASYLAFVRYCTDDSMPVPSVKDWDGLFLFMKQQALVGVGFRGVERMKAEGAEVPRRVLLQWYGLSERVRARNAEMNRMCVELVDMLQKDGLDSCILKGQGNAVCYPDPYARSSGDIDVFVLPRKGEGGRMGIAGRRKAVLKYVRSRFPKTRVRYQHIDFPVFRNAEVEMHFIPTAKNNPLYSRRLQKWAEERMEEQCRHFVDLPDGAGRIPVPTVEFNLVYQLSHLMHHFFDEGIGLRQMMDYYYLLWKAKVEGGKTGRENERLSVTLKHLNLYHFAGAVMYVMREVFGLEEERMIVPVDEWRGKTLMDEILKGGNFGKYSGLTDHSTGVKYFLKIKRNMRFVREYPAEALCEPLFRTWHFFWRLTH